MPASNAVEEVNRAQEMEMRVVDDERMKETDRIYTPCVFYYLADFDRLTFN